MIFPSMVIIPLIFGASLMQIHVSWMNISLVGGLEHEFYDFPIILGRIIPTDELIFFRGVETTNQSFIRSSRSHGWFETWRSCWIWCSDISQGAYQSTRSHRFFGGAALKTSDDNSQLNHWLMGVPIIASHPHLPELEGMCYPLVN